MNLYLENTGKGILITFLLLIGSMLYAQNNSKITIKKKNISLQTALADIREQTKMSVSYNSSQLPKTRISLDKQPVFGSGTENYSCRNRVHIYRKRYLYNDYSGADC